MEYEIGCLAVFLYVFSLQQMRHKKCGEQFVNYKKIAIFDARIVLK